MSGQQGNLSKSAQARLGLPEGFQTWSMGPFAGMNQQDARIAIADQEPFWVENFLLTGRGTYRTLWDRGPDLYVATGGQTILSHFGFLQRHTPYHLVFFTDGTAVQVNDLTGAVVPVSGVPNTFYTTAPPAPGEPATIPPACVQWGSRYLLIGNNHNANAYFAWDGTLLYTAGTSSPVVTLLSGGSGYTSPPTVTPYGGAGSGWAGAASVQNGSVVAVMVTNPGTGYAPGDDLQLAFSGGGSDTSAILLAVLVAGAVDHLELISGGSGYGAAPTLTFTGGGGSGLAAFATIVGGVVVSLTITNHGSGYTSTPTVVFSGGTASAVAILSGGSVASVTVVNGGTGFTGTPALTFLGGGGAGAAGVAVMAGGSIASVTMTSGGAGYISVPTVQVQAGLNNAAAAEVEMMPFGISGNSIETFNSRVWISYPHETSQENGGVFNYSAPGSFTDFSGANGGGTYNSADRYLRAQYVLLRQSNGYLYAFGDSSVSVVSNVQTGGSPTNTTFNYQNTDPQLGIAWRDSAQDFSRTIVFANSTGAYGLYGGAVRKISGKIDNLFANALFPPTAGALMPTSASASLYTIRCYLLLMTITDPNTFAVRNVMVMWDEANWYAASQSTDLIYIGTQEVNSQMTAWGTDGNSLFPLFQTPSDALTKTLVTKQFGGDRDFIVHESLAFYMRASDLSQPQQGIPATVTVDASYIMPQSLPPAGGMSVAPAPAYLEPMPVQPDIPPGGAPQGMYPVWAARAPDIYGTAIGATLQSNAPDFVLASVSLAYQDEASISGVS